MSTGGGNKAIFAPDGTELRFDHVLCYRQQTYGIEIGATDCYLTNCTVAENNASKGFEKAALCVADALPIGAKTGDIKVPIRFPGGG